MIFCCCSNYVLLSSTTGSFELGLIAIMKTDTDSDGEQVPSLDFTSFPKPSPSPPRLFYIRRSLYHFLPLMLGFQHTFISYASDVPVNSGYSDLSSLVLPLVRAYLLEKYTSIFPPLSTGGYSVPLPHSPYIAYDLTDDYNLYLIDLKLLFSFSLDTLCGLHFYLYPSLLDGICSPE